jgi:hypothetical protein
MDGTARDLWEEIGRRYSGLASDSVKMNAIREKLYAERYNPGKESVHEFADRLCQYQSQLQGDEEPPSNREIRRIFLSAKPKDMVISYSMDLYSVMYGMYQISVKPS